MRRLMIIASVAALAACSKPAEEAPVATEAAASAAATPAAVFTPTPGTYDVTPPGGTTSTNTLMADGVFVRRDAKGTVTAKGKWAVRDGKTCFVPEKGAEECYTDSMPAADGSFTATDANGVVMQIKPHAK